jgi:hypothetical protein
MTTAPTDTVIGLNEFFAASEARVDLRRTLNRVAKTLAGTGPPLMTQLHERMQAGDWTGFARLVQRIRKARLSNRTATGTTWSRGRRRAARLGCPTSCRPHMIGGFGLLAYPARYGESGVMTFIVNHDGVVYQRDLGPQGTSDPRRRPRRRRSSRSIRTRRGSVSSRCRHRECQARR